MKCVVNWWHCRGATTSSAATSYINTKIVFTIIITSPFRWYPHGQQVEHNQDYSTQSEWFNLNGWQKTYNGTKFDSFLLSTYWNWSASAKLVAEKIKFMSCGTSCPLPRHLDLSRITNSIYDDATTARWLLYSDRSNALQSHSLDDSLAESAPHLPAKTDAKCSH